jgi:hypothetical protein
MPEWDMEKYRFYLDLPGDFWESGTLLKYLREREVQVSTVVAFNTCYFKFQTTCLRVICVNACVARWDGGEHSVHTSTSRSRQSHGNRDSGTLLKYLREREVQVSAEVAVYACKSCAPWPDVETFSWTEYVDADKSGQHQHGTKMHAVAMGCSGAT